MDASSHRPAERLGHRAVVLGASMSGLLAARVLHPHFDEVLLLERDELPDQPAARKGTPHAVHPHGLLARGRLEIEALFPGFTQSLVDRGAVLGDILQQSQFIADGHALASGSAGVSALGASRLAIEHELRVRVRALSGVQVHEGVSVIAPAFDAARDRITGVRWRPRDEAADSDAERRLDADLVVDCTGRGSRAPAWLAAWGFEPPGQDEVQINVHYTSAYFRREGSLALGGGIEHAVVIGAATRDSPRPGVLIAQEPLPDGTPRWVIAVGGYQADQVEPTQAALAERTRALGSADLSRVAAEGTLIGEPFRYRMATSQRRRYERLRRFPEGLLVMGDAITSFNPIYGQGMTTAACEARALQAELARGLPGLSARFFKAASRIVDVPWQLSVGADLDLPCVQGERPLPVRLVNRYVARLRVAARHDAAVAHAFLRVVHMLDAPSALFRPSILWRAWRGGGPAPARGDRVEPLRPSLR